MEIKTIEFTNWSGQYVSKPGVYVIPETPEDLKEIISDKVRFPSPVVAIGSGHSNSGCNVVNGGTAVYMKKFRNINEPLKDEVTVGAGMQLFEVHRYLAERKLQLPFTPEIGNATVGSVACCCLKDAAIGKSSGIATGMIKAVKFIDADGNTRSMKRGDAEWELMTCSHGLSGIIFEATLDVIPMKLVIQNYVSTNVHDKNFEQVYRKALEDNDGIFGLADTNTGKLILETRNFSKVEGKPGAIENLYNQLDRNMFKYFNPALGAVESNWWSRIFRTVAIAGFSFLKISFPKGRRTFKNLKPIDYSYKYPYRWDFHFWAYPVSTFPTIVFPAFIKFLKEYKQRNPSFDEKGLMACYRIRIEKNSLLSPSYDEERMTLDPVRPVSENAKLMEAWDKFCFDYNEFAVQYGGKCTFNQTKVLSRSQVEKAFGAKWEQFKAAREKADPHHRFLSNYFKELMYGK
ncbi:MAG TPA: FAD-binding oxidoreductase [Bacteroidia bacterium]|nr:FAD-binding oxidoreductase [Bacteroidia bacterium]